MAERPIRAAFDGMSWPIPQHDAAYRMRYGGTTPADRMQAAAEMDAFARLIVLPQKQRNYICKKIKEAIND